MLDRFRVTHLPIAIVALLMTAGAAHAAFTSTECLSLKRNSQGDLQKCRSVEEAKALKGKPADLAKCATKFQDKVAKLNAKASKIGIACRFVDNGSSITDYDTGLEWVETNNLDGSANFGNPRDADNTYTWNSTPAGAATNGTVFTDYLSRLNNCSSSPGLVLGLSGFAGHCDWRLPNLGELQTILLEPFPCGTTPCSDPIFGPIGPSGIGSYWSSLSSANDGQRAWAVAFRAGVFSSGFAEEIDKDGAHHVRAVRGGL